MNDANSKKPKLTFLERVLEKFRGVFFDNPEETQTPSTTTTKPWRKVDWQEETTHSPSNSNSSNNHDFNDYSQTGNNPNPNARYPYGYAAPDGGSNPVEVWKRFEPVEFDDRMNEIGNQMQKTLEKRLMEVGEEMERRMGRRMLEVEEDVDRRVSRRILDSEESMDKRLSRKISELEAEVSALFDKKIQKANEEIESRIRRKKSSPLSRRVVIPGNRNPTTLLPAVSNSSKAESLAKIMHQLELLNRLKSQSMIAPEAFEKEKGRIDLLLEQLKDNGQTA